MTDRLIEKLAALVPQVTGTHYTVSLRSPARDEMLVMGWDDIGSSSIRTSEGKLMGTDTSAGGDTESWVSERVTDLLVQGWQVVGIQASAPRTYTGPRLADECAGEREEDPPPSGLN